LKRILAWDLDISISPNYNVYTVVFKLFGKLVRQQVRQSINAAAANSR